MKNILLTAKDWLVEAYWRSVAFIGRHPHLAFWALAILVVRSLVTLISSVI